jgi:hypothetical protein
VGCLDRSLSLPRVLLRSAGSIGSFRCGRVGGVDGMGMERSIGRLLSGRRGLVYGMMVDRGDRRLHLPLLPYLPLYPPTLSQHQHIIQSEFM